MSWSFLEGDDDMLYLIEGRKFGMVWIDEMNELVVIYILCVCMCVSVSNEEEKRTKGAYYCTTRTTTAEEKDLLLDLSFIFLFALSWYHTTV
jgi:hypothetical protein